MPQYWRASRKRPYPQPPKARRWYASTTWASRLLVLSLSMSLSMLTPPPMYASFSCSVSFIPKRWNSTLYGKPRASGSWLTLAMMGDSSTSITSSACGGVWALCGMAALSHCVAPGGGVVGSPSPVCQTPNIEPNEVWKPQGPDVLYSQTGFKLMLSAIDAAWRKGAHPPGFLSKLHGIR